MGVGPHLSNKFTWLCDEVEVKGVVLGLQTPDGEPLPAPMASGQAIGANDHFEIVPDANYKHLVSYVSGSNYPRGGPSRNGVIHCETYIQNSGAVNYQPPWRLGAGKGADAFTVHDPRTSQTRELRVGDHVRVVGRWLIENGHAKYRYRRGALEVGYVFVEFHPFDWAHMDLVVDPAPDGTVTEMVTVAAPMYEELYPGTTPGGATMYFNWAAGVGDKIYVAPDSSNFHNRVVAKAVIKAPPLPAGHLPHGSLIDYSEHVIRNDTGLFLGAVRNITIKDDGIEVNAAVTAGTKAYVDSVAIADYNDPANGHSVFQATYDVRWKPRLHSDWGSPIDIGDVPAGSSGRFSVPLRNVGPSPVGIERVGMTSQPSGAFSAVNSPTASNPVIVPAYGTAMVEFEFAPPSVGAFSGDLIIDSTDPARRKFSVRIEGEGVPAPAIRVSPTTLDFGKFHVGDTAMLELDVRNAGFGASGDVWVDSAVWYRYFGSPLWFWTPSPFRVGPIPAQQTKKLQIYFSPQAAGPATASLDVFHQVPVWGTQEKFTVQITGEGDPKPPGPQPTISVSPVLIDFGALAPGASAAQSFEIENTGVADLNVSGLFYTSAWSGAFWVGGVTFPLVIGPGNKEVVDVTFYPSPTPGTPFVETMELRNDDWTNPAVAMTFQGETLGGRLIWPDLIDFGQVQPNAVAAFDLKNLGSAPVTIRKVSMQTGKEFAVGQPPRRYPVKINGGATRQFTIVLKATAPGIYRDRVIIENDTSRPRISINVVAEIP
jgi:hypothetical protein